MFSNFLVIVCWNFSYYFVLHRRHLFHRGFESHDNLWMLYLSLRTRINMNFDKLRLFQAGVYFNYKSKKNSSKNMSRTDITKRYLCVVFRESRQNLYNRLFYNVIISKIMYFVSDQIHYRWYYRNAQKNQSEIRSVYFTTTQCWSV